jgi:hypothetical protein
VKAEPSQNEESEISSASDDDDMIYDNDYYPLVGPPPQWHHSLPPLVPAHDWEFQFNTGVINNEAPFFAATDNPQMTVTDFDDEREVMRNVDSVSLVQELIDDLGGGSNEGPEKEEMELDGGAGEALAKTQSIGIVILITFPSNTSGVIEGCSK